MQSEEEDEVKVELKAKPKPKPKPEPERKGKRASLADQIPDWPTLQKVAKKKKVAGGSARMMIIMLSIVFLFIYPFRHIRSLQYSTVFQDVLQYTSFV